MFIGFILLCSLNLFSLNDKLAPPNAMKLGQEVLESQSSQLEETQEETSWIEKNNELPIMVSLPFLNKQVLLKDISEFSTQLREALSGLVVYQTDGESIDIEETRGQLKQRTNQEIEPQTGKAYKQDSLVDRLSLNDERALDEVVNFLDIINQRVGPFETLTQRINAGEDLEMLEVGLDKELNYWVSNKLSVDQALQELTGENKKVLSEVLQEEDRFISSVLEVLITMKNEVWVEQVRRNLETDLKQEQDGVKEWVLDDINGYYSGRSEYDLKAVSQTIEESGVANRDIGLEMRGMENYENKNQKDSITTSFLRGQSRWSSFIYSLNRSYRMDKQKVPGVYLNQLRVTNELKAPNQRVSYYMPLLQGEERKQLRRHLNLYALSKEENKQKLNPELHQWLQMVVDEGFTLKGVKKYGKKGVQKRVELYSSKVAERNKMMQDLSDINILKDTIESGDYEYIDWSRFENWFSVILALEAKAGRTQDEAKGSAVLDLLSIYGRKELIEHLKKASDRWSEDLNKFTEYRSRANQMILTLSVEESGKNRDNLSKLFTLIRNQEKSEYDSGEVISALERLNKIKAKKLFERQSVFASFDYITENSKLSSSWVPFFRQDQMNDIWLCMTRLLGSDKTKAELKSLTGKTTGITKEFFEKLFRVVELGHVVIGQELSDLSSQDRSESDNGDSFSLFQPLEKEKVIKLFEKSPSLVNSRKGLKEKLELTLRFMDSINDSQVHRMKAEKWTEYFKKWNELIETIEKKKLRTSTSEREKSSINELLKVIGEVNRNKYIEVLERDLRVRITQENYARKYNKEQTLIDQQRSRMRELVSQQKLKAVQEAKKFKREVSIMKESKELKALRSFLSEVGLSETSATDKLVYRLMTPEVFLPSSDGLFYCSRLLCPPLYKEEGWNKTIQIYVPIFSDEEILILSDRILKIWGDKQRMEEAIKKLGSLPPHLRKFFRKLMTHTQDRLQIAESLVRRRSDKAEKEVQQKERNMLWQETQELSRQIGQLEDTVDIKGFVTKETELLNLVKLETELIEVKEAARFMMKEVEYQHQQLQKEVKQSQMSLSFDFEKWQEDVENYKIERLDLLKSIQDQQRKKEFDPTAVDPHADIKKSMLENRQKKVDELLQKLLKIEDSPELGQSLAEVRRIKEQEVAVYVKRGNIQTVEGLKSELQGLYHTMIQKNEVSHVEIARVIQRKREIMVQLISLIELRQGQETLIWQQIENRVKPLKSLLSSSQSNKINGLLKQLKLLSGEVEKEYEEEDKIEVSSEKAKAFLKESPEESQIKFWKTFKELRDYLILQLHSARKSEELKNLAGYIEQILFEMRQSQINAQVKMMTERRKIAQEQIETIGVFAESHRINESKRQEFLKRKEKEEAIIRYEKHQNSKELENHQDIQRNEEGFRQVKEKVLNELSSLEQEKGEVSKEKEEYKKELTSQVNQIQERVGSILFYLEEDIKTKVEAYSKVDEDLDKAVEPAIQYRENLNSKLLNYSQKVEEYQQQEIEFGQLEASEASELQLKQEKLELLKSSIQEQEMILSLQQTIYQMQEKSVIFSEEMTNLQYYNEQIKQQYKIIEGLEKSISGRMDRIREIEDQVDLESSLEEQIHKKVFLRQEWKIALNDVKIQRISEGESRLEEEEKLKEVTDRINEQQEKIDNLNSRKDGLEGELGLLLSQIEDFNLKKSEFESELEMMKLEGEKESIENQISELVALEAQAKEGQEIEGLQSSKNDLEDELGLLLSQIEEWKLRKSEFESELEDSDEESQEQERALIESQITELDLLLQKENEVLFESQKEEEDLIAQQDNWTDILYSRVDGVTSKLEELGIGVVQETKNEMLKLIQERQKNLDICSEISNNITVAKEYIENLEQEKLNITDEDIIEVKDDQIAKQEDYIQQEEESLEEYRTNIKKVELQLNIINQYVFYQIQAEVRREELIQEKQELTKELKKETKNLEPALRNIEPISEELEELEEELQELEEIKKGTEIETEEKNEDGSYKIEKIKGRKLSKEELDREKKLKEQVNILKQQEFDEKEKYQEILREVRQKEKKIENIEQLISEVEKEDYYGNQEEEESSLVQVLLLKEGVNQIQEKIELLKEDKQRYEQYNLIDKKENIPYREKEIKQLENKIKAREREIADGNGLKEHTDIEGKERLFHTVSIVENQFEIRRLNDKITQREKKIEQINEQIAFLEKRTSPQTLKELQALLSEYEKMIEKTNNSIEKIEKEIERIRINTMIQKEQKNKIIETLEKTLETLRGVDLVLQDISSQVQAEGEVTERQQQEIANQAYFVLEQVQAVSQDVSANIRIALQRELENIDHAQISLKEIPSHIELLAEKEQSLSEKIQVRSDWYEQNQLVTNRWWESRKEMLEEENTAVRKRILIQRERHEKVSQLFVRGYLAEQDQLQKEHKLEEEKLGAVIQKLKELKGLREEGISEADEEKDAIAYQDIMQEDFDMLKEKIDAIEREKTQVEKQLKEAKEAQLKAQEDFYIAYPEYSKERDLDYMLKFMANKKARKQQVLKQYQADLKEIQDKIDRFGSYTDGVLRVQEQKDPEMYEFESKKRKTNHSSEMDKFKKEEVIANLKSKLSLTTHLGENLSYGELEEKINEIEREYQEIVSLEAGFKGFDVKRLENKMKESQLQYKMNRLNLQLKEELNRYEKIQWKKEEGFLEKRIQDKENEKTNKLEVFNNRNGRIQNSLKVASFMTDESVQYLSDAYKEMEEKGERFLQEEKEISLFVKSIDKVESRKNIILEDISKMIEVDNFDLEFAMTKKMLVEKKEVREDNKATWLLMKERSAVLPQTDRIVESAYEPLLSLLEKEKWVSILKEMDRKSILSGVLVKWKKQMPAVFYQFILSVCKEQEIFIVDRNSQFYLKQKQLPQTVESSSYYVDSLVSLMKSDKDSKEGGFNKESYKRWKETAKGLKSQYSFQKQVNTLFDDFDTMCQEKEEEEQRLRSDVEKEEKSKKFSERKKQITQDIVSAIQGWDASRKSLEKHLWQLGKMKEGSNTEQVKEESRILNGILVNILEQEFKWRKRLQGYIETRSNYESSITEWREVLTACNRIAKGPYRKAIAHTVSADYYEIQKGSLSTLKNTSLISAKTANDLDKKIRAVKLNSEGSVERELTIGVDKLIEALDVYNISENKLREEDRPRLKWHNQGLAQHYNQSDEGLEKYFTSEFVEFDIDLLRLNIASMVLIQNSQNRKKWKSLMEQSIPEMKKFLNKVKSDLEGDYLENFRGRDKHTRSLNKKDQLVASWANQLREQLTTEDVNFVSRVSPILKEMEAVGPTKKEFYTQFKKLQKEVNSHRYWSSVGKKEKVKELVSNYQMKKVSQYAIGISKQNLSDALQDLKETDELIQEQTNMLERPANMDFFYLRTPIESQAYLKDTLKSRIRREQVKALIHNIEEDMKDLSQYAKEERTFKLAIKTAAKIRVTSKLAMSA